MFSEFSNIRTISRISDFDWNSAKLFPQFESQDAAADVVEMRRNAKKNQSPLIFLLLKKSRQLRDCDETAKPMEIRGKI